MGPVSDPKRRGASSLKVVAGVLGALVSVVLTGSVFFKPNFGGGGGPLITPRFHLHDFLGALPRNLHWLLPFCALSALTLVLRAVQWRRTLAHAVPFKERYHLVAIGALVHNALPGKLGDITRAFLLARTRELPFVETLGSVAVCKLLELVALMLVLGLSAAGPLGAMLGPFAGALKVAIGLSVGLLVLTVLLARNATRIAGALKRRGRLPKLHKLLVELEQGFVTARSVRGLSIALLFSVGPVLAPSLGYGLGLAGLGIPKGLFAGPIILGAIAVGQSVLLVPAGMGLYYFVTSYTARSLGASPEQAAAFATLTHLGTVLTQVAMGAVSLYLRKIRWKDLRRRTHDAEDAEHDVDREGLAPLMPQNTAG